MPFRRLSFLVALLAALAFAAPAHALDRAGLATTLAKLHARMGPAAGAYVVDEATGEVLFAHRENLALAPASNEKLFVSAAALLRFGPQSTLTTTLRAAPDATIEPDGTLDGDLYLVGGGDPTLGDAGLGALADQLAARGITRIRGAVVGDESLFDTLRGGPDSGYGPDGDLGGWLSALSWRHGDPGKGGATGPARAAAARLGALLKQRDVLYDRKPRAGTLSAAIGAASASDVLASLDSPPMATLLADTLLPSENFYAEMLTKALGVRFGTGGSTAAGLGVVRDQLAAFGVHPRLVDGSGLSRADRTTARQVVRLLVRMDGQTTSTAWNAALPIAGRSGTIRKRMRRTAAAGRCDAKTGTLIGVSALSGYCTTVGGRRVVFSLLENRVSAYYAKKAEDRMVAAIARLGA